MEINLEEMDLEPDQIVVLSVAGSYLYGTDTLNSDKDYLGIYIPTERQLLLNDYPKQKSLPKKSGLDLQIWSIHYFMKLACQGETMAIDLLHAPDDYIVMKNSTWDYLKRYRKRFFTKKMKSFVSYARKQAAKYGIKGTRIETLETVINAIKNVPIRGVWEDDVLRLKDIWHKLPKGDHIHFLDTKPFRMYQVAGKKFQETVTIEYAINQLEKSLTEYGKRAMLAKENQGIDWKAISHAVRSIDQVHDILTFGDYEYPLRNADFIRNIKLGKLDFAEVVQPYLEEGMNEIEEMIEKSNLPDEVDKEFWNEWLIFEMKERVLINDKWID